MPFGDTSIFPFFLDPEQSGWEQFDLTTRKKHLAPALKRIVVNPCQGHRLRGAVLDHYCVYDEGLPRRMVLLYRWFPHIGRVSIDAVGEVNGAHDPFDRLRSQQDLPSGEGHTAPPRLACCEMTDSERRELLKQFGVTWVGDGPQFLFRRRPHDR